jgi:hypothetical protein
MKGIPKDMQGLEITTASGVNVNQTKQLSGEATAPDLHGSNTMKAHKSGAIIKGQGMGGKPFARK